MQFDALRMELKLRPADMASRFRELGATATAIKSAAAAGGAGSRCGEFRCSVPLIVLCHAALYVWVSTHKAYPRMMSTAASHPQPKHSQMAGTAERGTAKTHLGTARISKISHVDSFFGIFMDEYTCFES